MNEQFIKGNLYLKIDGHWYIDHHKLSEGSIIEILIDDKWTMHSLEYAHGVFYCFPSHNLSNDVIARIEISSSLILNDKTD